MTVICQYGIQNSWTALHVPNGASGGGVRVRVGSIVYLMPFASVMLPPCFQFILLRVASGLQSLLSGWKVSRVSLYS